MNNPQAIVKKAELEQRNVNIATLRRASNPNLSTSGVVYCGRNRSRQSDSYNPLDLGLGNPFAHKNTRNCVWRVDNIAESLSCYRVWLWKLIQNEHTQNNLTDWERLYLYRFLHLCNNLEWTRTLVCFCVNRTHNALNKADIQCHTQILWNAMVYYNCQKLKL